MIHETREQSGEMVRTIWNRALTLKICMSKDIVREEECPCGRRAWCGYDGPIVVSGDGVVRFCEDCVRVIDPTFVVACDYALEQVLRAQCLNIEVNMDALAAKLPSFCGFIERAHLEAGPLGAHADGARK